MTNFRAPPCGSHLLGGPVPDTPATSDTGFSRPGGGIEKCQTDGSAPSARDAANSSDSSFSTARCRTRAPSPRRRQLDGQSSAKVAREAALPHGVTSKQRTRKPVRRANVCVTHRIRSVTGGCVACHCERSTRAPDGRHGACGPRSIQDRNPHTGVRFEELRVELEKEVCAQTRGAIRTTVAPAPSR